MNEKPFDNIIRDGGFTRIFRTIGCIGDSLSSGEFESMDKAGNRAITICLSIRGARCWAAPAEARYIIFRAAE